ncbi:MAG: hypothetical protein NC397_04215, partial [Clostridium sp.]|nr:hypothetical protein [Clostridium sp.]
LQAITTRNQYFVTTPQLKDCLVYYALLRRLSDGINIDHKFPILSDYEDAGNMFNLMQKSRKERDCEKRAKSIYCLLLKTYTINFKSKKSAEKKLIDLIEFCNKELGVYFEYLTVLAYLYFKNNIKRSEHFFKRCK